MIARILAAGAVIIGCGFAGVHPTAAATESDIVLPPVPAAVEQGPTLADVLPPGPAGDGGADDGAESPPASEPSASPSPSPSPDPIEPEPTPSDAADDPETAETLEPGTTMEAPPDEPSASDAVDDATGGATDVVEPVASDPEPLPSPTASDAAIADPPPSGMPEPAPADDVASTDPPLAPEPEAALASPAPMPSPAPAPVDLIPSDDASAAYGSSAGADVEPAVRGAMPMPSAASPGAAPSSGQSVGASPSAGVAPPPQSEPLRSPAIPVLNPWSPLMGSASRVTDTSGAADVGPLSAIEHMTVTGAGLALMGQRVSSVSVAVDFARSSGGWAGPLVFNVWLRRQLRERRISQRHLGMLSGVNHSAISRLINGHASPTLETATKLVHALHMEWTDDQIATYFDLLPEHTLLPTQRVESALRGDGSLSEAEVRAVMQHYLVLRARRKRAGSAGGEPDGRRAELPPAASEF